MFKVVLGSMKNLTDVSPLSNVRKLSIMDCVNVTDISMLGNIPYLLLSDLPGVKDISKLGNHVRLIIQRVGNHSSHGDLSHLGKIRNTLRIGSEIAQFQDASVIKFLQMKVNDFKILSFN